MYLIISVLIALYAASGAVMVWLLLRERGEKWHWKIEAATYLSRMRTWQAQAESFEAAGKTLEEHLAAERGRADRLAAALRESEDKAERMENELVQAQHAHGLTLELANIFAFNGTEEGQAEVTDG